MKEQVLVIGLGQFGMSLARTLNEKGFQVIAVDMDQKLVNEAANFVTDAICLNAIDEISLSKLSPKDRDIVICSIGSKEPSILTVALLKQMGCENIIARASETIHARILKAIGAKKVINPEHEYGKRFANRILFKNIFSDNTSDDLDLLEVPVQPFMTDKTLVELKLPDRYKVIVAGIIKDNKLSRPIPQEKLQEGDRLLLTGNCEDIERMIEENK